MEEEVKTEEAHEEQKNSYDEKREIELIAQVRASYDVIGNALSELEAMHADMPVATADEANVPEERQEDGAKDETEATNIDNAEADVKEAEAQEENKDEKSEADDETKYY